ncbi:MAG: cell division protein ZapA [candidate division WOR-3 bacterium]
MKSVAVQIFGSEYYVRADRDVSHVQEIADIVDRKMREIDQQFPQPSSTRTAVLACMNLVDEYSRWGQEENAWLAARIGALADRLEEVL